MVAPIKVYYDVDLVSDLRDLVIADSSIADADIKKKIFDFDKGDLVLVTKTLTNALKITDVSKIDPATISTWLK